MFPVSDKYETMGIESPYKYAQFQFSQEVLLKITNVTVNRNFKQHYMARKCYFIMYITADHGKSRQITAYHGKSRYITADHGKLRQITAVTADLPYHGITAWPVSRGL